jgi:hypothetical protein
LRKSNNQRIFKDIKSSKNIGLASDIVEFISRKKYQQALELAKKTDM